MVYFNAQEKKDTVMAHEFNRKFYGKMLEWKRHLADRYALLVEGARRVGKTYLVTKFVESEYENFVYIDFSLKNKVTKESKRAFEEEPTIENTIERLAVIQGVRLIPGRTCFVFDEVQRYPPAREAIKALMAFGKYHYIETGSLLGIKENVEDIVIPSEEHSMKLHPLDFEEFLDALGEDVLKDKIREAYAARVALPDYLHDKAMRLFRIYMVVGGMPQSVLAYLDGEERKLEASEFAKREIIALYLKDIGKYAKGYSAKVRAVFRNIPGALNSREKKFHLSDLSVNARMRRYENAFLWLADAMVANIAYNATSPEVGLEMSLESSLFKCYSLDTGLLLTQAMSGTNDVDGRLLRGVLYDNLGINEGMFFENAVAQSLTAQGVDLLFHSVKDSNRPERTMEIDFLFRNGIKICPVEVKSSRCREHVSLDRFIAAYAKCLGKRYVVTASGYFSENGIEYLPIYMTHLIVDSVSRKDMTCN